LLTLAELYDVLWSAGGFLSYSLTRNERGLGFEGAIALLLISHSKLFELYDDGKFNKETLLFKLDFNMRYILIIYM